MILRMMDVNGDGDLDLEEFNQVIYLIKIGEIFIIVCHEVIF